MIELNEKYNFSRYITGCWNECAIAVAKEICDKPGLLYNPVIITSETCGNGTTHLMKAIALQLRKNIPTSNMYINSAEKFTIELIKARRNNKINDFRTQFSIIELFLLDDLQFLDCKVKESIELSHLIQGKIEENKQVVLTSDKKSLGWAKGSIFGKCNDSFILEIQKPNKNDFLEIFEIKAYEYDVKLYNIRPKEIIEKLEKYDACNIRQIERILIALKAQRELLGSNDSLVQEVLFEFIENFKNDRKN